MNYGFIKLACAAAAASAIVAGAVFAGDDIAKKSAMETKPPFSGPANVAYAAELWRELIEAKLVGPDSIVTYPYKGTQPHGKVLEYMEDELAVGGHRGIVMVKKNYVGDEDVDALIKAVLNDRAKAPASITVMYQREAGYDPDNDDWFWAKYLPDGSLATNPKKMKLAGRVAKGADAGCIACHMAAPGGDLVFTHDRWATP